MNKQNIKIFFETLSPNTSVEQYGQIYARDVFFKDPFNQTNGVDAIYEIFQDMYKKLDAPRFEVIESVCEGNVCYVKWCFRFCLKAKSEEQSFEGISRMQFNDEERIISHIDYWDSAEHVYGKIPLLGSIIGFIKKRIAK